MKRILMLGALVGLTGCTLQDLNTATDVALIASSTVLVAQAVAPRPAPQPTVVYVMPAQPVAYVVQRPTRECSRTWPNWMQGCTSAEWYQGWRYVTR